MGTAVSVQPSKPELEAEDEEVAEAAVAAAASEIRSVEEDGCCCCCCPEVSLRIRRLRPEEVTETSEVWKMSPDDGQPRGKTLAGECTGYSGGVVAAEGAGGSGAAAGAVVPSEAREAAHRLRCSGGPEEAGPGSCYSRNLPGPNCCLLR